MCFHVIITFNIKYKVYFYLGLYVCMHVSHAYMEVRGQLLGLALSLYLYMEGFRASGSGCQACITGQQVALLSEPFYSHFQKI